jgi:hypothetical protein
LDQWEEEGQDRGKTAGMWGRFSGEKNTGDGASRREGKNDDV